MTTFFHVRSRNDNDFALRYPDVTAALAKLPDEAVIGGEVCALDAEGRPSFQILQNYGNAPGPVVFFIIDLLVLAVKGSEKRSRRTRIFVNQPAQTIASHDRSTS